jgi:uncharacterized lipoprotein
MKRIAQLLLAGFVVAVLAGCGDSTKVSSPPPDTKLKPDTPPPPPPPPPPPTGGKPTG